MDYGATGMQGRERELEACLFLSVCVRIFMSAVGKDNDFGEEYTVHPCPQSKISTSVLVVHGNNLIFTHNSAAILNTNVAHMFHLGNKCKTYVV